MLLIDAWIAPSPPQGHLVTWLKMSSFVAAEAGGFYFNFTRTSMFLQLYATVYITRIYSGEMKFIALKGGKKIFLLIPLQKPKKNIDICSCKFASSGLLLPAQ